MNIKKYNNFKINENFNYNNHNAFKNKLKELISDNETIDKILNLIPEGVILPKFYIGDKVKIIEEETDDEQIITDVSWKKGRGYIL